MMDDRLVEDLVILFAMFRAVATHAVIIGDVCHHQVRVISTAIFRVQRTFVGGDDFGAIGEVFAFVAWIGTFIA
jgi:hypothetical protein